MVHWFIGRKGQAVRRRSQLPGDSKLGKKGLEMEVTLREMQQAERDEARAEAMAAEAEAAAGEWSKKMAALREKLDDLVLQVGVVQAELEKSGVEAAKVECDRLWRILHTIDRRFQDLWVE